MTAGSGNVPDTSPTPTGLQGYDGGDSDTGGPNPTAYGRRWRWRSKCKLDQTQLQDMDMKQVQVALAEMEEHPIYQDPSPITRGGGGGGCHSHMVPHQVQVERVAVERVPEVPQVANESRCRWRRRGWRWNWYSSAQAGGPGGDRCGFYSKINSFLIVQLLDVLLHVEVTLFMNLNR